MELLVNGLLRRGARRERLEGKLFGGARTMDGLADIGARNAAFAERFLRHEGIRMSGGSLARRSTAAASSSGRSRDAPARPFSPPMQTPAAEAVLAARPRKRRGG